MALIFGVLTVQVNAQLHMGARMLGMGQVGTALPDEPWSLFANPAMIDTDGLSLGFYGLRNYGLPELTDMSMVLTYPWKEFMIASGAHRYGNELFSETRFIGGASYQLQDLRVGVSITYLNVSIGGGYGSAQVWQLDAGIAYPLITHLWIGSSITNVSRSRYPNDPEELPQEMSIGFSYQMHSGAVWSTDLVKDVQFPMSLRSGLDIQIMEMVFGRAGITTNPLTYSLGLGIRSERWETNIAFQQHEYLGLSPGMDLMFKL